jgi:hypothetical protein
MDALGQQAVQLGLLCSTGWRGVWHDGSRSGDVLEQECLDLLSDNCKNSLFFRKGKVGIADKKIPEVPLGRTPGMIRRDG